MIISLQKSNQLKSIAILMMLFLHLFNQDYHNKFSPLLFIFDKPLTYYISLFCDACVPIFAFVSGYGLYYKYLQNRSIYSKENVKRLKKLYINYWVVLILFAVILGWIIGKDGYPESISKFLLNLTGFYNSYNGAWWFFTIYVLFVLTSTFWFRLLKKVNPYFYVLVLLVIYVISFYFRIYDNHIFKNEILHWLHTQLALYFCTLLQFMLGAFFLEFNWNEKLSSTTQQLKFKNVFGVLAIILLIVLHGIIPNFIIAPFTGLCFIFIFLQFSLPSYLDKLLDFFAPHSTNIWLIHMFFYMIYFPVFIYSFNYPTLIFSVLLLMCLGSSYIVNFIINKITRWV
ncbi:acyltransferase family protein [Chryseobacterium sp. T1]